MRVVVSQKGSREHFLAARALHRKGMLAQLVLDWYVPFGARLADRIRRASGGAIARAMDARHEDLPRELIRTIGLSGATERLKHRWHARRGAAYRDLLERDRRFAETVSRMKLPPHEAFFGYSYASLETMRSEKARGSIVIVDQIDPGLVERRIVADERKRWSDYALPEEEPPDAYYERARQEWRVADAIIVNSEWTRDAIISEGADARRVEVIPLAYEAPKSPGEPAAGSQILKVLWLGDVILRKGIQYLIEAARLLRDAPVQFMIVGMVGVSRAAIEHAPRNMQWLGPMARGNAQEMYSRCDIFVLPTVSDGFAITQIEALSHGLPVIVTPNCGRVVEDGVTGFVVPPRDPEMLAAAIERFLKDRSVAGEMRPHCLAAARRFSVDAYADRLTAMLTNAVQYRDRN